jgi:hypothetical protein
VREFLAALSPSELTRIVELFRMQMNLSPLPPNARIQLSGGEQRPLPGRALAATNGK